MNLTTVLNNKYKVGIVANSEMLECLNDTAEALWIARINVILVKDELINDVSTIGHEAIHVLQETKGGIVGEITCKLYEILGYDEVVRIKGLIKEAYEEDRVLLELQSYGWEKWYQLDPKTALDWLLTIL